MTVKVDETLVLAQLPELGGNGLVRVSDPNKRVSPVPETLMVIEAVPVLVHRFIYPRRLEDWAYVRYVFTRSVGDRCEVEGLEFGPRYRVPLYELPSGLAVRVRHIPFYAQPPFKAMIWPDWKLPPKKKWLVVPRRGAH
ncbi:MAG: hypothetical protein HY336_02140 [Candidatus Doudnabacteria bacterium]|nr:hypothetical protein [Candidatus Doudnabacteria bacterium]